MLITAPLPTPPVTETVTFRLRPISPRQAVRVLSALVFATVACLGMVILKRVATGTGRMYYYLIWNLALAWIPLLFSFAAYQCYSRKNRRNFFFAICALAWFLFFPNAPYITTDVVHIHDDPASASWFHLMCIMAYAWTGLSLGYVSLYLMQEIVRARCGRAVEWLFVLAMLGAGTLGIYLGRFLRWNSWDVLRHPVGYLRWGYHEARPFDDANETVFIGTMFVFLLISYGILYTLTHLHEPEVARK